MAETAATHGAFASVASAGPAPVATAHVLKGEVAKYLGRHVDALLKRAANGSAPPARFLTGASRKRFEDLATAGAQDLDRLRLLAQAAAEEVQRKMDKRANPGLLAALVLPDSVALLKLEARHTGAQLSTAGGNVPLVIIERLVDQPGQLQMGAAYPDARDESEVVAGQEQSGTASAYFLNALGIGQMEQPSRATRRIVTEAFRLRPQTAPTIARLLAETSETDAAAFIGQLPDDLVDPLTRKSLERTLTRGSWPIERIAPQSVSVKRTLEASGITVSGAVSDMDRVTQTNPSDGVWKIEIELDEKPRERYG